MIRALLNRFAQAAPDGNTEAALSHEGLGIGWALLLFAVCVVGIWWGYHRAGASLPRWRRALLVGLRMALAALFLVLLVKPVLLITRNDPVRERLLVLIDDSQSMSIKDQRAAPEDVARAGIAANLLAPDAGVKAPAPEGSEKWKNASRLDLFRAVSTNERLNLWPRLEEKADLFAYRFGREAHVLGPMTAGRQPDSARSEAASTGDVWKRLTFAAETTALGDSLRQVLEENRGQPVTGILLVTDGANNAGSPPEEAAELAKQAGLPIYAYGIGITGPKDIIVRELTGPRGAFIKERAEFTVKVRAPGFSGQTVKLRLRAQGKIVDEKEIALSGDGESEYQLGFVPQENGEVKIEASIDPLDGETSTTNNAADTRVRVLDNVVKVLYVEQEPRWDFRYLLSTLQRDRRLSVKCVLFDGGAEMVDEPNTIFLHDLPARREDLVENEIIILGDVDPKALGPARMQLINEWVSDLGGGLIFLAGPKQDPLHYGGTPLEPLLPVEINRTLTDEQYTERSRLPIKLRLTPTGEFSPLLRLSENGLENNKIWNDFPGVRWTARVARAKPTAQVYLEAVAATADGSVPPAASARLPVIAQQDYGRGTVMYFGFDETYRWRSRVGEKYYARIWNQIIQSFSLERQLGASARTQLKMSRPEYAVGDKVIISGKLFTEGFAPMTEASVPGTLISQNPAEPGAKPTTTSLPILAVAGSSGEYQAEFIARTPGEYRFSTILDPKAVLKFDVTAPRLEMNDTAMNASLLQTVAQTSGGRFLREEDLNGLPELLAERRATVPTFQKRDLFYSPWWMAAVMVLATAEWLLRRLWQLR